jgi:hypothetical protein
MKIHSLAGLDCQIQTETKKIPEGCQIAKSGTTQKELFRYFLIFIGALLLCTSLLLLVFATSSTVEALPEYAAQTGEPCSSCHISPSGGGPRGPRGQAWVASNKPGVIPDLVASLELLGVEMSVDPAYFTAADPEVQEAEALSVEPAQSQKLFRWLSQYDGN